MRAARLFTARLAHEGKLAATTRIASQLFGSPSHRQGHGSDNRQAAGPTGYEPDTVDVERVPAYLAEMRSNKRIPLDDGHSVAFPTSPRT